MFLALLLLCSSALAVEAPVEPDPDIAVSDEVPLDVFEGGADDLYIAVGVDPDDPSDVNAFVTWLTGLPEGLDYETFSLEYERQGYLMTGSGREFCYQVYLVLNDYDLDVMAMEWIRPAFVMHGTHNTTGQVIDYLITSTSNNGSTPTQANHYEAANISDLKAASGGGMTLSEFQTWGGSAVDIYYYTSAGAAANARYTTLLGALGAMSQTSYRSTTLLRDFVLGSYSGLGFDTGSDTVTNPTFTGFGTMVGSSFFNLGRLLTFKLGPSRSLPYYTGAGSVSVVDSVRNVSGFLSYLGRTSAYGFRDVYKRLTAAVTAVDGTTTAVNGTTSAVNSNTSAMNANHVGWMEEFARQTKYTMYWYSGGSKPATMSVDSLGMGMQLLSRSLQNYLYRGTGGLLTADGTETTSVVPAARSLVSVSSEGFLGLSRNLAGSDKSASYSTVAISDDGSVITTQKTVSNLLDAVAAIPDAVQSPLAKLQFMFAQDDDLAFKGSYKEQEDAVKDKFTGDSSNSLSAGQIGDMAGLSGTLVGAVSGADVSIGNVGTVINDTSVFSFFSQAVADDLDSVNSASVASASLDSFSDSFVLGEDGFYSYSAPSVSDYLAGVD